MDIFSGLDSQHVIRRIHFSTLGVKELSQMYGWRWPSFHPFTFSPFSDSFHFEPGKFANKGDVPAVVHPLISHSKAVRKVLICGH